MLPASIVEALRPLTKLPRSVRGTIELEDDGTSRITTKDPARSRPERRSSTTTSTVHVRKYSVVSPTTLAKEGEVRGPAVLSGSFTSQGSTFGGVAAEQGEAAAPRMVSFLASDVMQQQPSPPTAAAVTVPFVTQNALMPLAPTLEAVRSVFALSSSPVEVVVVACVNGLFVLSRGGGSGAAAPTLDSVYSNLLSGVDFVVDGRSSTTAPSSASASRLCRISKNAICVYDASAHDHSKIEEVQNLLHIKPYDNAQETLVAHNVPMFTASASLLDVSGDDTDFATLREAVEAAMPGAKVKAEPLERWQTPPLAMDVKVVVTPTEDLDPRSSEPQSFQDKTLLHGGTVGLVLRGSRPTLRPHKVGEEPGSLERRFERLVRGAVHAWIAEVPEGASSPEALTAASERAAHSLRETLSAADVFAVPVEVKISTTQLKATGPLVSLPSGLQCSVPPYAVADPPGARLSALLAVLPSLGLRAASFTSWSRGSASGGVPMLT